MPARTGTDGRGGRLRAVHATASASTSRATRNFISRPTRSRQRPRCTGRGEEASGPGAVLMVPAAALGGNAGPILRLWNPLGTAERSFPTQSVVQGILDPNNSSSSSHVWKLGTEAVRAAQGPIGPVGGLWVVSASPVSTRGHLDGCAP